MNQSSGPGLRVLAIVPVFNEEATIQSVVLEILEKVPGIDVCVVNDGSVDNTEVLAKKSDAVVITHP